MDRRTPMGGSQAKAKTSVARLWRFEVEPEKNYLIERYKAELRGDICSQTAWPRDSAGKLAV